MNDETLLRLCEAFESIAESLESMATSMGDIAHKDLYGDLVATNIEKLANEVGEVALAYKENDL